MTDNQHGSDSDSVLHDDHEHQTETWQEDHPPEDDFHDTTGESSVVTETEEESVAAGEARAATGSKKSGAIVVASIAVVGLLFVGAMLYLQFGGSSRPAASPMADMTKMLAAKPVRPAPDDGASAPAHATAMISSELLPTPTTNEAELGGDGSASNSTVALPTAPVASEAVAPKVSASAAASPVAAAPGSASVTPTPAPLPVPAPGASQVGLQASAVMPIASLPHGAPPASLPSAATSAVLDSRLDKLTAQVESLQKALDQMQGQVTHALAAAASTTPAPTSTAANQVMEERLSLLEKRLASLEGSGVHAPALVMNPAPSVAAQKPRTTAPTDLVSPDSLVGLPGAVEAEPAVTPVTGHPASKVTHKARAHGRKHHPVASSRTTHWVLRAATPDAAWISASANAPDLRRVAVGDTVPGIGKVRAIRQMGDRWMVVGTKGSIR